VASYNPLWYPATQRRIAVADSFKAWLREAREGSRLSQSQLDEVLVARAGKKAGYTAQLENGRVKAPDKSVCIVIAEALARDPEEAWRVSALERMRIAEVLDFHEEELDKQRSEFQRLLAESRRKMTQAELIVVDAMRQSLSLAELVESVRTLQEHMTISSTRHPDFDLAQALIAHLDDVKAVAASRSEQGLDKESVHEQLLLWNLLHNLYGLPGEMPFDERRQLINVVEGATEGLHAGWSQAMKEGRAREAELRGDAAPPEPPEGRPARAGRRKKPS
jgi:transcriptional regulator with XRE-family HTH domain